MERHTTRQAAQRRLMYNDLWILHFLPVSSNFNKSFKKCQLLQITTLDPSFCFQSENYIMCLSLNDINSHKKETWFTVHLFQPYQKKKKR